MNKLFIIILLFISLCLWAQNVPQTIDYQGRLADSDGNYLNSVVTIDFLIYDADTGGTLLWSETQDVSCTNGIFHVQLGSLASFPGTLFDGSNRWLELIVSSETLSPRTAIAAVPFAIKAETAYTLQNMGSGSGLDADLLDGQDSSDFMPASTTFGDITAVTANYGLSGGGTSGDVILNVQVPLNHWGNVPNPNSVINGVNTGSGYGVYGEQIDSGNYGYLGSYSYAVYGRHDSSGNYGSIGTNDYGVYGRYGSGGNYGYLGSSTIGAFGRNYVDYGQGVQGINYGSSGQGVYGINYGISGSGVFGYNSSVAGKAVYGHSTGYFGGYFTTSLNSSGTHVVHAEYIGTGSTSSYPTAVYGKSQPVDGRGIGGYFRGGYYGISCVGPNYAGYFSGNVHVSGTFTNPSDERLKENVQPFRNALSKIKLMDVHTFNFIQMAEEKQLILPEGEQIGLIAQELEEILPELVEDIVHTYDKNEDIENAESDMEQIEYKGINYIGLIPVLIEAIKELQIINEEHKQRFEEQQIQIDELLRSAGN